MVNTIYTCKCIYVYYVSINTLLKSMDVSAHSLKARKIQNTHIHRYIFALVAGAVEYTDCNSAEG